MKNNDKYYCIKNYYKNSAFNNVNFHKGRIYKIIIVEGTYIPYRLIDDNNTQLGFHPNSPFYKSSFKNYFLSLKEYRKQKLLKLKNNAIT